MGLNVLGNRLLKISAPLFSKTSNQQILPQNSPANLYSNRNACAGLVLIWSRPSSTKKDSSAVRTLLHPMCCIGQPHWLWKYFIGWEWIKYIKDWQGKRSSDIWNVDNDFYTTVSASELLMTVKKMQNLQTALKLAVWGCPGGPVVKNVPCNARDTGSVPGSGRSHVPQSS